MNFQWVNSLEPSCVRVLIDNLLERQLVPCRMSEATHSMILTEVFHEPHVELVVRTTEQQDEVTHQGRGRVFVQGFAANPGQAWFRCYGNYYSWITYYMYRICEMKGYEPQVVLPARRSDKVVRYEGGSAQFERFLRLRQGEWGLFIDSKGQVIYKDPEERITITSNYDSFPVFANYFKPSKYRYSSAPPEPTRFSVYYTGFEDAVNHFLVSYFYRKYSINIILRGRDVIFPTKPRPSVRDSVFVGACYLRYICGLPMIHCQYPRKKVKQALKDDIHKCAYLVFEHLSSPEADRKRCEVQDFTIGPDGSLVQTQHESFTLEFEKEIKLVLGLKREGGKMRELSKKEKKGMHLIDKMRAAIPRPRNRVPEPNLWDESEEPLKDVLINDLKLFLYMSKCHTQFVMHKLPDRIFKSPESIEKAKSRLKPKYQQAWYCAHQRQTWSVPVSSYKLKLLHQLYYHKKRMPEYDNERQNKFLRQVMKQIDYNKNWGLFHIIWFRTVYKERFLNVIKELKDRHKAMNRLRDIEEAARGMHLAVLGELLTKAPDYKLRRVLLVAPVVEEAAVEVPPAAPQIEEVVESDQGSEEEIIEAPPARSRIESFKRKKKEILRKRAAFLRKEEREREKRHASIPKPKGLNYVEKLKLGLLTHEKSESEYFSESSIESE